MPPVGLKARVVHAGAVVLDALQHPASFLKFLEAEHLAFIDGALSPGGSPVPKMLVDEYYLAQAFVRGQEKRRNKYGFALGGRWVYHEDARKRFQKADDPIVKPHEECGGCLVDDVRKSGDNEGAVDEAFRQVDPASGLQVQSRYFEHALSDSLLDPLREPKRRKQVGFSGNRFGRSAQAASVRAIPGTPPDAARSPWSTGLSRASVHRLGDETKEQRTTISDAEAVAFRSPAPVPFAQMDN